MAGRCGLAANDAVRLMKEINEQHFRHKRSNKSTAIFGVGVKKTKSMRYSVLKMLNCIVQLIECQIKTKKLNVCLFFHDVLGNCLQTRFDRPDFGFIYSAVRFNTGRNVDSDAVVKAIYLLQIVGI